MPPSIFIILVLFLIVMIHEAGHLIVAKCYGVGVPVFSVGFGPRIIGIKFYRGKIAFRLFNFKPFNIKVWAMPLATEYRLAPIPFGGFCAMQGELESTGSDKDLIGKPYYQKVLTALGGPVINIITGYLALFGIISRNIGLPKAVKLVPSVVKDIVVETTVHTGKIIQGIETITPWSEVSQDLVPFITWEGFLIQFGIISIVIALFNLLPFPALDGSLPFLWLSDKLIGKDLGQKVSKVLVLAGFWILMIFQALFFIYWIFYV